MTIAIRETRFQADAKAGTIEVVWTSGARVRRRSWDGSYDEELLLGSENVRLDRLNQGAPFLDSHGTDTLRRVIGLVVPGSAMIRGGRGLATVRLSTAPEDAAIVHKIRDGTVRHISVGYKIHKLEKAERGHDVPLWRITDWEPLELSAVAIPADPGAYVRLEPQVASAAPHVVRMRMRQRAYEAGVRI